MLDRYDRYSDYPPGYADEEEAPGLLKRVMATLARYPIRTAAALVLTVGPAVIIANAVFFQHGEHPSPFFATRPGGDDVRAGIRRSVAAITSRRCCGSSRTVHPDAHTTSAVARSAPTWIS